MPIERCLTRQKPELDKSSRGISYTVESGFFGFAY